MVKIKNCLPHNYYLLLKSYLTERLFQVKQDDTISNLYDIRAGVPQGSVLGRILYTIYTADLPVMNECTTATADDTAILASHENPETASLQLQAGLDLLSAWLQKWRIKASTPKLAQVTFTLRRAIVRLYN